MVPIVAGLLKGGLSLVANAFLAKGKEWVEEKAGITLDPKEPLSEEQLVALRKFEMDNEVELRKLQIEDNRLAKEIDEMYLKDTQSARQMQMTALEQDDVFAKRFVYYFASFWSLGAAIYIAAITFMAIPEANTRFADTILGFLLGTIVAQIISYFYGSSKSSQNKDKLKDEMLKKVLK
ncbi:MAG: hypothetical protein OEX12_00180 [Gammaproteobacteria bacterium]|nr:hypothetical protein [Gammaproteobacteria bacterium]